MGLRHCIAALAAVFLLAGCGSGQVRRITPSQVSIQELSVQPGGAWHLRLRIQNYSTISMTYASLHGTLHVAGVDVGTIDVKTDFDIPANSADVVDTTLHASAALPAGDIEYKIEGTIETTEPKETFKFNRSSRLSPTPGLANTWR
ncbi:MAG TPA: LEA type 2 family protein [Rhodanobacteraceae bacterium]|nr:LEA type 2 family protein [Rhodanobacteraceae bacterium]